MKKLNQKLFTNQQTFRHGYSTASGSNRKTSSGRGLCRKADLWLLGFAASTKPFERNMKSEISALNASLWSAIKCTFLSTFENSRVTDKMAKN